MSRRRDRCRLIHSSVAANLEEQAIPDRLYGRASQFDAHQPAGKWQGAVIA
jgi:hypothetical protein